VPRPRAKTRVTLAQSAKGSTSGRNPRHLQDHASPRFVLDSLKDSLIVGSRRGQHRAARCNRWVRRMCGISAIGSSQHRAVISKGPCLDGALAVETGEIPSGAQRHSRAGYPRICDARAVQCNLRWGRVGRTGLTDWSAQVRGLYPGALQWRRRSAEAEQRTLDDEQFQGSTNQPVSPHVISASLFFPFGPSIWDSRRPAKGWISPISPDPGRLERVAASVGWKQSGRRIERHLRRNERGSACGLKGLCEGVGGGESAGNGGAKWAREVKVRGRLEDEGERSFIEGRRRRRTVKAATAALSLIGGPAGDARPEGAGAGQHRAGGRGRRNDGLMGAVCGAPLAVAWNTNYIISS
jgi:hypothetical protein